MVSSRKPLRLDTTKAGPSTGTRAASKEAAAGTPAETATLRDGPDDEGANSDAGSSHGEPAAEPSGGVGLRGSHINSRYCDQSLG